MFNQSRFLGGLLGIIYFVWISSALGCSKMVSARLYDMESGAVSEGTFHFKGSTHGRVELQLTSGELLVGEYNTIPGGVSGWGQIYSTVWSGTISPNALIGTAIATWDAGTILECEYITNSSRFNPRGHGAARDNRGRSYKLMFGER